MFSSYLLSAFRALKKHITFSFINILGLTVGIASVLIISLFVIEETSYDKFFDDSERIHRISLKRIYPERERMFASSATIMAEVIKENYPEVEEATRLHRMYFVSEIPIRVGEDVYNESRFYFADENFFKVFSHNFIHGDPNTALNEPGNLVITEETANKYFGTTDVLNRTVKQDTSTFLISGIIEDIPANSHIHFDVLGNINQVPYLRAAIDDNNWINPWLYTYIKLNEGADPDKFESQLDEMVDQFGGATIAANLGENYAKEGHKFEYFLQPLESIHLHSDLDIEVEPNGNYDNVLQLSAIALVILIISAINFINLSTAKSADRAKEVGIRKVMGSLKSSLVFQFITESILLTLFSAGLALLFVCFVLPSFNNMLGRTLDLGVLFTPMNGFLLIIFVFLVGILSGMYPAVSMSNFHPLVVLKGSFKTSSKGNMLRNSLIVFQFLISIVMISTTVAINKQMGFMRNLDLGFTKTDVVVIPNAQTLGQEHVVFRNRLLQNPDIVSVGGSFGLPGDFIGSNVMQSVDHPDKADFRTNMVTIDDYFFETMEFELVEGRSFEEDYFDSTSVIVNEAVVRELGLTDPIGSKIQTVSSNQEMPELTIVGVVRDYNFMSLHNTITPLVINNGNQQFNPPKLAVRYKAANPQNVIEQIEGEWNELSTEPFSYTFLDESLEQQYAEDQAAIKLFDVFTYLAIFISCIGLFGLATYLVHQKAREMSIRKVMGAPGTTILILFLKDFLKLGLLAFVLAVPLAFFAIENWLEGFAYHIGISAGIFLLAGGLTLVIILITLIYQTLRIVGVNPVEIIRED